MIASVSLACIPDGANGIVTVLREIVEEDALRQSRGRSHRGEIRPTTKEREEGDVSAKAEMTSNYGSPTAGTGASISDQHEADKTLTQSSKPPAGYYS